MPRSTRFLALSAAAIALCLPVTAQEVPPEADTALWCSIAFSQIAPKVRASGQVELADKLEGYGQRLTDVSLIQLITAGFTDQQIKDLGGKYIIEIAAQLAPGAKATRSVDECTRLAEAAPAEPAAATPATEPAAPAAPAAQ